MDEFVEAFVNLLGCGMFALVFAIGGFLTNIMKGPLDRLTAKYNLGYNHTVVSLICKGIVIAAAFVYCLPHMPSFSEVLDNMLPFGDFRDITAEVATNEDKWLFNVIFNIFTKQLAITAAYFVPYILIDQVISLCVRFLAAKEEKHVLKTMVGWVTDTILLYSVNALVLCSGMMFPELMLHFLEKYDFSSGVGYLLLMLIPSLLLIFAVLRSFISSDILISTLGISVTISTMGITLHDGNRWYIFAVTYGCSFIARMVRRQFVDEEDVFKGELVAALLTLVGSALVAWGIFSL